MGLVDDILSRWSRLASDRAPFEQHWMESARYVLPDAERFDGMFASTSALTTVTNTVVGEPVAAQRGKEVYDQTSIWAVDRGAAGELSLITPQTGTWHDLASTDPFAPDPSDEEAKFFERVRDYLFKMRANPYSGFWPGHKSALRCKWAFGTAVLFVRESQRGIDAPVSYVYIPLSENYLGTNYEGLVDTNYRVFIRSARQCLQEWGSSCSAKTKAMADDPKKMDQPVTIIHAVQPREERGSYGNTVRDADYLSCYIEVGERHLLNESGYYEFPYRIDHWQRNSTRPYAEGPVSLCLAEIKSLNAMAKNELQASQQMVAPPMITHQDVAGVRLDLNPRAINAGYMTDDGRPRAQALITARPDFAQSVLEARRLQIRTTLYIDLWQTVITASKERDITAYQAMLMDQEKADALGPIGTSSQVGLYFMVERELGILARMGAFDGKSPLRRPDSLGNANVGARFTSPLDRARKLGEFQSATQLVTLASQLESVRPGTADLIDFDEFVNYAQETLGAPRRIMASDDTIAATRDARAQQAQSQAQVDQLTQAAQAAQAGAVGADALASSPAASSILESLAGVSRQAA